MSGGLIKLPAFLLPSPIKMGRGCLEVGRNTNRLEGKLTPVASKGSVEIDDFQVEAPSEGFVLAGWLILKPLL